MTQIFIKVPGGVIVRTEESWTGAQIEADPATAIRYLAPGLDEWQHDVAVGLAEEPRDVRDRAQLRVPDTGM